VDMPCNHLLVQRTERRVVSAQTFLPSSAGPSPSTSNLKTPGRPAASADIRVRVI